MLRVFSRLSGLVSLLWKFVGEMSIILALCIDVRSLYEILWILFALKLHIIDSKLEITFSIVALFFGFKLVILEFSF